MVLAFKSPTDRMMARVAITIFTFGAIYGIFAFGRPIYWRFYANVLRPFEDGGVGGLDPLDDDPFSAAVVEQQKHIHGQSREILLRSAHAAAWAPCAPMHRHIGFMPLHADAHPVAVKTADPVKGKKPFSVDDYPFTKCEHDNHAHDEMAPPPSVDAFVSIAGSVCTRCSKTATSWSHGPTTTT